MFLFFHKTKTLRNSIFDVRVDAIKHDVKNPKANRIDMHINKVRILSGSSYNDAAEVLR